MPGPTTDGPGMSDVLQGTLDMLVLKALSLAPMHGWGISSRPARIARRNHQWRGFVNVVELVLNAENVST